jgi:hypothetical protein
MFTGDGECRMAGNGATTDLRCGGACGGVGEATDGALTEAGEEKPEVEGEADARARTNRE